MHLDQHVEPDATRQIFKIAGFVVGEGGHDQQNAIGADGAAFMHLPGVEDEILAQDRQADGGARGFEMRHGALEIRAVGQHREANRTAVLIGAGDRRGVEIGADQAAGWRGFLDFGDQPGTAGSTRVHQGAAEAARWCGFTGAAADGLQGYYSLAARQLGARGGADFGQYVFAVHIRLVHLKPGWRHVAGPQVRPARRRCRWHGRRGRYRLSELRSGRQQSSRQRC